MTRPSCGCGSRAWCRRFDGCPRREGPAPSVVRLFGLDVHQRPGGAPSEFDEAVSELDEGQP